MTDLEEEVLFRLSDHRVALPVVVLADEISGSTGKTIPLATVYRTILRLSEDGLIDVVDSRSRRQYRITDAGLNALQQEWNYHRQLLKNHA